MMDCLPDWLRWKLIYWLLDRNTDRCWASLCGWANREMEWADVRNCNLCASDPYTYCGKPRGCEATE